MKKTAKTKVVKAKKAPKAHRQAKKVLAKTKSPRIELDELKATVAKQGRILREIRKDLREIRRAIPPSNLARMLKFNP